MLILREENILGPLSGKHCYVGSLDQGDPVGTIGKREMDPYPKQHGGTTAVARESDATSFLRLGALMLREAREKLAMNRNARDRVAVIIDEVQRLTNEVDPCSGDRF
ncbi:MAG: hypothetical protein NTW86_15385 [Candidatus Sumerlaeota bacterium]|nr:hypothetical protein [Candidatus Sumerlaeota bacterium]